MSATYLSLNCHLVFSTKARSAFIRPCWIDRCHAYLGGIVKGLEAIPEAIGGTSDHVHLLVGLRSTHCLATFMCELKKSASVWVKENHEPLFLWQTGYAAFTVGTRERDTVRQYILNQEEHHRNMSSLDELETLLREHRVDYDPRYFE